MELGNFRLGMRTIKTGIAVAVCILLFHYSGRGTAMIASLSAVFALRQDMETTVKFGKSRILGNTLGALLAALFILLYRSSGNLFILEVIGVPVAVMLIIVICDGINYNSGIIGAIATLLIIYFSIPPNETIIYALERVFDTFIGTFVAVAVNHLIKVPAHEEVADLKEELSDIQTEENELNVLLTKKENEEKNQETD
ncbi:hypothetical protein CKN73_02090 [Carnobacterium divergens]|uniref:FUSC family protein n=1 Tax=Carnobacterium divergens TaxID=2748 RepID=UPI0010716B26|nr:aromatic acid exporter family protein [Carnobacterium divergens]MDT2011594.1 aromatic acid exporter family protein [Carnobacterium divergens]TFJ44351.1 hypothetical protein CKN77_02065 [Carnobacterium divergens]TFJ52322.1 hypothetical protein CKN73_02090 [Carnobacterium divergens]TFJ57488.1 hypothetical protein CKN83_02080 [Carnobacterium divergens]TFJ65914.1 hypothetical protein CKN89_02090 [Carnobacterium divergens]